MSNFLGEKGLRAIAALSNRDLKHHTEDKSNPHGVTYDQVNAAKSDHDHDERYYRKPEIDLMFHDLTGLPTGLELYGFRIDQRESNPKSMITYVKDNKEYMPACMNFSTGRFDYGDWSNAFFIKGLKPVMLKYDGTVAYELDPNDYSKKKDGTPSDISNDNFDGNAMMAIPKVYWKIVSDDNNSWCTVYISNEKVDKDFRCWSHIDNHGNEIDYCYMAIYNGSLVGNKLRSLSGKAPMTDKTRLAEVDYAKANNIGTDIQWYTGTFSDRILIQLLLMLISKTTDSQTAFGRGNDNNYNTSGVSNYGKLNSGTMNQKGLFWGSNNGVSGVKVFGIEHFWGNMWNGIAGWINDKGVQKIKMTYGKSDGSTVDGYNFDGNGYITIPGSTPVGTSGGFINKMIFTDNGLIPTTASGSSSTYFCDGLWINNGQVNYALVGGNPHDTARCGSCCASLNNAVSAAYWSVGASLSYKPLA